MKIGELSARSGVSARSLRYYEQHELLAAHRESNGYREYDEATVERAETIHMLFGMGFSREVVHAVLACSGPASEETHDALADKLEIVRTELAGRIEQLTDTHERIGSFLLERGR